jgi:hypothetical protein
MLAEQNEKALGMNENDQVKVVLSELEDLEWYSNIIYYLKNSSCPSHLVDCKIITLRLKLEILFDSG